MSNTAATTQTASTPTFEPFSDVVDKYAKADKGDKARIRTSANKKAMEALASGQFDLAGRWAATAKLLTTEKAEKEIDHSAIAQSALATILAAKAAVEAYAEEHNVELAPRFANDAETDKADKLAKSLLSVKSDSHSIDAVFERAFEGKPVGTVLKVAEICSAGRTEDYLPGSGAVAARLRGDGPHTLTDACTVAGVEPVWVAKDGSVVDAWTEALDPRVGARKVA